MNIEELLNEYYRWLKDKTIFKKINEKYIEITTPYLDRHNDYIQIYISEKSSIFSLTDGGSTIIGLLQDGCNLNTEKRKKILEMALNGFAVRYDPNTHALSVDADKENFPIKKHNLLQAILAINDMFYLAESNIANIFLDDVKSWFDNNDIRYSENVTFTGRSGYARRFDFLIPKSKQEPERLIKTLNNPNKSHLDNIVMDWIDTMDLRPEAKPYVFVNDNSKKIHNNISEALINYNITPIFWTKKDEMKQRLIA